MRRASQYACRMKRHSTYQMTSHIKIVKLIKNRQAPDSACLKLFSLNTTQRLQLFPQMELLLLQQERLPLHLPAYNLPEPASWKG